MTTLPWYATREQVAAAMDLKLTARSFSQVDRTVDAASRSIERLCHRRFYPEVVTRRFDWPDERRSRSWRLWLDDSEFISVTSVVSGGVEIVAADYFLEPANEGPPYDRLEVDLSSLSAFVTGGTRQRNIAVTGVAGYDLNLRSAGALAEALDASETTVDVTNSASVGVGDLIQVDSERMVVTDKTLLTTGQTVSGSLAASVSTTSVSVSSGAAFSVGEEIQIDAETMRIVAIAGNTLTVIRQWDGTVLATHANGATIYAPRTLTVERGALGTTAATHGDATAISTVKPPALIQTLAVAEAVVVFMQETAGWNRTVGAGEAEREAAGRGLKQLREEVRRTYGRRARAGVV